MEYIPDMTWDICAFTEKVSDANGLEIIPTKVKNSLDAYEIVFVPGAKNICRDAEFIEWIKTAEPCPLKVSVCTGSLILGLAGFLTGKKATTHPTSYDELKQYAEVITNKRVVDDGDVITARGVSASIDLGLYMCEKLAGNEAKEIIRSIMDYEK